MNRRDLLKLFALGAGAAALAPKKFIFDMGANLWKIPEPRLHGYIGRVPGPMIIESDASEWRHVIRPLTRDDIIILHGEDETFAEFAKKWPPLSEPLNLSFDLKFP